jgi:hypothetical protein
MQAELCDYAREIARLRATWRREGMPLAEQHRQLMCGAQILREVSS